MPSMTPEMYGLGQAMMKKKAWNPYQDSVQRPTDMNPGMGGMGQAPGMMGSLGGKPYVQDTGMSEPAGPTPQPAGPRKPMIAQYLMNRMGGQPQW